MNTQAPTTEELVRMYLAAKSTVIERGFAREIVWQASAAQVVPSPAAFMREAAWVVLSAGMSESVVRSVFRRLSAAMCGFDPAALSRNRQRARVAALAVFGHERKIVAVLDIAATVSRLGADALRAVLRDDPEQFLRSLPYIGPVTWRHLAKNLGLPVAKPDRHLTRVAFATGRMSVDALCDEIAEWLGEPVAVVDLVLWRWCVLHARECRRACDLALDDSLRRITHVYPQETSHQQREAAGKRDHAKPHRSPATVEQREGRWIAMCAAEPGH